MCRSVAIRFRSTGKHGMLMHFLVILSRSLVCRLQHLTLNSSILSPHMCRSMCMSHLQTHTCVFSLCLYRFITPYAYVFKSDISLYILHATRHTFAAKCGAQ